MKPALFSCGRYGPGRPASAGFWVLLLAALLTAACASGGPAASSLPEGFSGIAGKTWKLTAVEPPFPDRPPYSRADFADAGAYTLSFDAEAGRVSGKAFPNRYVGPYRVDGESIAVESLAGTLMAALNEPESLREREYYDALESARSWELSGGRLILHTEKDGAARDLVFEEE